MPNQFSFLPYMVLKFIYGSLSVTKGGVKFKPYYLMSLYLRNNGKKE